MALISFKVEAGFLAPSASLLNTVCPLFKSIKTMAGLPSFLFLINSPKTVGIRSIFTGVIAYAFGITQTSANRLAINFLSIK